MRPLDFPQDPVAIWSQFYQITQIPRPSKKEDLFREYILNLAVECNLTAKTDTVGNVVVYMPGSKGKENNPTVIIQNHMDMVTDHAPGKEINFETDPILTLVKDGWLKADRTTLGADNGIGCAASLALMVDPSIIHPPLELLFTTDEETGLNGAWGVDTSLLSGRVMLNLDTEEWGSLYIGCAGGIDYELNGKYSVAENKFNYHYKVDVSGLIGGHSGVDIHLQHANSIKILGEFLTLLAQHNEIGLSELRAGRAHNIIPREGSASFSSNLEISKIEKIAFEFKNDYQEFLSKDDQGFTISITKQDSFQEVLSTKDTESFLNYITLFPHGAHSYDLESEDTLVDISNNLAVCILKKGQIYTLTSLRFFDRNQIKQIELKINSLAKMFNFTLTKNSEYPSWKPARESDLLEKVKTIYQKEFNEVPQVKAIHAGLECGILRDKIGNVDVISFGPTIMGAHSPDERIEIKTVKNFWKLFTAVLKEL